MRNISDTIRRLTQAAAMAGRDARTADPGRLQPLHEFGDNPGSLRAYRYVPLGLPGGAPLVVVLHGCTQTAAGYDEGAGWSRLADRHGFGLLFAEQRRANNPNRCFNWFRPGDSGRDAGEPLSIANMVRRMLDDHHGDPDRVFVTGLSAGGAMAATMLATFPDIFAGGAVIAGLPYGSAASVPEAFDRMRGHGIPARDRLAARLRAAAAGHGTRRPTLSIWHGTADRTVAEANAEALGGQWRDLHGLPERPTRDKPVGRHHHRIWCDGAGHAVLEDHRIAGMGHGTPVDASAGADGGVAGPYMLDTGIASSKHILRFWGLESGTAEPVDTPVDKPANRPGDVRTAIETAFRAAGLTR